MLSTSGMLQHVEANPDGSFIVATENGMLYPLQQAAPQANLIEANRMAFCKYMKMITLPKLRDSLAEMKFEVSVAGRRSPSGRGSRSSAWSRSASPHSGRTAPLVPQNVLGNPQLRPWLGGYVQGAGWGLPDDERRLDAA